MRKSERLFQIIQILRRSTRPVTSGQLAAELEVARRTVYRDIADLVGQRVPIIGEAGLGYILDPRFELPPLMLTVEEVEALVLGAQMVATLGDPGLERAAQDLMTKVRSVLPTELHLVVTEPAVGVKPRDAASPANHMDTRLIRRAIRDQRKLSLHYRAATDEVTTRKVWPLLLGFAEGRALLIARCENKGAFRHFRTDRIVHLDVLEERIGVAGQRCCPKNSVHA